MVAAPARRCKRMNSMPVDFFYGDKVRQITGVAARTRIFGAEILCHLFFTAVCDTEDNKYLSTLPAVARTVPRRAQEPLGCVAHDAIAVGGGYLGAVDLTDPIELLASGKL